MNKLEANLQDLPTGDRFLLYLRWAHVFSEIYPALKSLKWALESDISECQFWFHVSLLEGSESGNAKPKGLIPCPEKPPSIINKIGIITFIYSCEEDSVMKLFSYLTLTPSLEPYLVSPIQSVWIPVNSSFKLNVESGHLSLSPLPYWSIPLSGHLWTSAPAPHCCLCVHKLWSF